METILDIAQRVFAFLDRFGARGALVGGLAVSARSEPRFTRDIDIAIDVADDESAERLLSAIRRIGFVTTDLVEQEATGRLATARCVEPEKPNGIVVDLLFASSGIEREIVASAKPLELSEGFAPPVAEPAHLLAMKVLSRSPRRLKDDLDIQALLGVVDDAAVRDLRLLLHLIEERGFHRGKSLQDELEALLDRNSG